MKIFKTFLSTVLSLAMMWPCGTTLAADAAPAPERNMIVGDIETIDVKGLTRVSVTDPAIVDISDAQNDKVTLLAKKAGQTALFLWDSAGKHTYTINVARQDLLALQSRLNVLLKAADVNTLTTQVDNEEGKIIIAGGLTKDRKARIEKLFEPYNEQIIDLIKEDVNEDLIQIDMQITEVASTLDKNLGFDWQGGKGGNLAFDYEENGTPTGGSKDWFKFGSFNRTTAIVNTINLLISEGKAKDLSRPRILVSSGKEATINVGGEVPVQSTTTNSTGGLTQSNVTFKQYGVTVTVTPTIKNGKIDIVMNLEVSDVDNTFPVKASSTSDIAYKTRSAQTQLVLDDRQTVVFAGLVRYSESEQIRQVPFLGKVPIVGILFRNVAKQSPDQGRELVVTLTPTIMRNKKFASEQMKMPTQNLIQAVKDLNQEHGYSTEPISEAGIPAVEAPVPEAVPAMPAMPKAKMEPPAPAAMMPGPVAFGPSKVDALLSPYVRQVQNKISQGITYPYEALQKNWQGTVKLKLRIRKDGSLADAAIINSSGHDVFDKDALNSARIAAPFSAFGPDMGNKEDLTLTLPIVYSQNAASTANAQTVVASY